MDLDANALLLGLAISSVGFVCLSYGKKQQDVAPMLAGLVLLIFPYFVSNLWLMGGIAAAVVAALWVAKRLAR